MSNQLNKTVMKNEIIHLFRSERNGTFNNPSKFYVGTVERVSLDDICIHDSIVTDDAGNELNITPEDIKEFEDGKTSRIVIDWDGIYDTSYYVRDSKLTTDEEDLISAKS